MWYVKDEFSKKIYFKSNDIRETQNFVSRYNRTFKFAGQRAFRFVINDFSGFGLFRENKVDINSFTLHYSLFDNPKYVHPLAIKGFHARHVRYVDMKFKKVCALAKKYHLWSYTSNGRKADSFDF